MAPPTFDSIKLGSAVCNLILCSNAGHREQLPGMIDVNANAKKKLSLLKLYYLLANAMNNP